MIDGQESAREKALRSARHYAELFFLEFGEPLDPEATDWDSHAWEDTRTDLGLSDDLWPEFQAELIAETQRLVARS